MIRTCPDDIRPTSLLGLTWQSILLRRRWTRGSSPRVTVEQLHRDPVMFSIAGWPRLLPTAVCRFAYCCLMNGKLRTRSLSNEYRSHDPDLRFDVVFSAFGPTGCRPVTDMFGISRPKRRAIARTSRIMFSATRRSPFKTTFSSIGASGFFRLTERLGSGTSISE